ncbi:MAG: DUF4340 domain-containing protein, partial [Bacteroidia bacterium]|nr:DUF4340 domain-containing protein [Bacteroidia bacterium]
VILVFTVLVKIPRESATIKDRIVEFDSTKAGRIILYPKPTIGKAFEVFKDNGIWKVQQDNIVSASRKMEVENIMSEILSIKPQNLVSKSKSKWIDFEVTDSTGTRIRIQDSKGRDLADLIVGRFTFKQADNQLSMYGRNNIQGTSYVRVNGENEVYGIDGFLSLSFNRSFNDWRDNTLAEFNKLTSLSNVDGQEFNDTYKPDANPDYQLMIEGNNLLNINVKCYRQKDGTFIINSSLNPGIFFSSKADGVFNRVFKSKKDLI